MSDTTIYQRFRQAQQAIKNPSKRGKNPHFKSEYATLDDVLESIKKPLNDAGLSFCHKHRTVHYEGICIKDYIHLVVTDDLGNEMDFGGYEILTCTNAQAQGSNETYLRRYSLMSAFGIVGDEDDDGNAAVESQKQRIDNRNKYTQKKPDTKREHENLESFKEAFGAYVKSHKESGLTGELFKSQIEYALRFSISDATEQDLMRGIEYINELTAKENNQEFIVYSDIEF